MSKWPKWMKWNEISKLVFCKKTVINCFFIFLSVYFFNPFMHNVVKWPNILKRSCVVNTARFLKSVWPFYNIMYERVKKQPGESGAQRCAIPILCTLVIFHQVVLVLSNAMVLVEVGGLSQFIKNVKLYWDLGLHVTKQFCSGK